MIQSRKQNAIERLRGLYTAVVADILDQMGMRNQVMEPGIRPIYQEAVVVGRAVTALSTEVSEVPSEPFKKQIEIIDSLRRGDVLVATVLEKKHSAFWGELVSTAARIKGAEGVIVDGYTRDIKGIIKMKFPVFARGVSAADAKGRSNVTAHNIPITCGGVLVRPGDLVIADYDGVVVIPQEKAGEAIKGAEKKCAGEKNVGRELAKGEKLSDVFARYGIL